MCDHCEHQALTDVLTVVSDWCLMYALVTGHTHSKPGINFRNLGKYEQRSCVITFNQTFTIKQLQDLIMRLMY